MPDFAIEDAAARSGAARIAGIDEAGRGPLAGPVFAAAVVIAKGALGRGLLARIDDSKVLAPPERDDIDAALRAAPGVAIGVGHADVLEIDSLNILQATFLAMARAVAALGDRPDVALVDGSQVPRVGCPVRCVVGGDGLSLSIAAASIVAKVARDRVMIDMAARFPGYGWERNKGYGTAEHRAAIRRLGVTPEHRRSFAPIAHILGITSA